MTTVHEAHFSENLSAEKVRCTLCPQDCRTPDNGRRTYLRHDH